MIHAFTAFVLSFGTMILAYVFLRPRVPRAEIKAQANRVAQPEQTALVAAEKKAPALIRKDRPDRGGPLRALTNAIHVNEYIANLLEGAAVQSTPNRFLRNCVMSAICGGGLVF